MNYKSLDTQTLSGLIRAREPGAIAYVREAMAAEGGNASRAAKVLGVSRSTLWIWLGMPGMSGAKRRKPGRPKKADS